MSLCTHRGARSPGGRPGRRAFSNFSNSHLEIHFLSQTCLFAHFTSRKAQLSRVGRKLKGTSRSRDSPLFYEPLCWADRECAAARGPTFPSHLLVCLVDSSAAVYRFRIDPLQAVFSPLYFARPALSCVTVSICVPMTVDVRKNLNIAIKTW